MITQILQFMCARGAGEASLRRFISFVTRHDYDESSKELSNPETISQNFKVRIDVAKNIIDSQIQAKIITEQLEKENVITTWIGHKLYPSKLVNTLDKSAPPVLFCKGNIEIFEQDGVGFCGSRKASEKGLVITSKCAEQLVQRKISVISGYAHGVDLSAHKAALRNGGNTIFVLVEGILRFQKKREILDFLSDKNFLAVSQFPPLLTWSAMNAMHRNSTIIGLSKAMILVESGLKGGTFAAGEETLKRHQPLFVIDFAAPGPSAEANPYFIEKGGLAIRGSRDGHPNISKVFDIVSHCTSRNSVENEIPTTENSTGKNVSHGKQGSLLD